MNKKRSFIILQLVANDMVEFFPYFFIFYIICLIVSFFNESWHTFFYWPAFHVFILCFALISIFSETVREPINKNIKKTGRLSHSVFSIFYFLFIKLFYRIGGLAKKSYLLIIKNLTKKNIFKIIIIAMVLSFTLYKNIAPIDFITIFYALVAFIFLVDSRISVVVVLVLLTICPVALIFKRDGFAELSAIYAYYFLIITVISQVKEVFLNGKNNSVIIHKH